MTVNFVNRDRAEPGLLGVRDYGQGYAYNPLVKASQKSASLVPGEKTVLIMCWGQSMTTNCVDDLATPVSTRVHNFSMFDGGMYSGEDPQLGCSWGNGNTGIPRSTGSLWPYLGDKLIDETGISRVIVAPVGTGGSSIQSWAPIGTAGTPPAQPRGNNFFDRLEALLYQLELAKLVPSRYGTDPGTVQAACIVNIGETDAGSWGATAADWEALCLATIEGMRGRGLAADVPFLVTQNTYPFDFADDIIRAAQAGMVDPGNHIYSGGDTDTLGATYRQADNIHWNASGAEAAAGIFSGALQALGAHWQ